MKSMWPIFKNFSFKNEMAIFQSKFNIDGTSLFGIPPQVIE